MDLLEKFRFIAEGATAPNDRAELKKPNEDRLFFDEANGVFILLDGVTRAHGEYDENPYESASGDIGDIFICEVCRFISENTNEPDAEKVLRGAIRAANMKIHEYRSKKSESEWKFYPSTLGMVGLLRERVFHYAAVGDCLGVLIRNNTKMLFGKEWSLEALDKQAITKKERYELYCNHPENALSYTVFNGDKGIEDILDYSFIDLRYGDILLLASDGISDYVKYEKSKTLAAQSTEQMIALSSKYDVPPYAKYADDKALIKITFST